MNRSHGVVGWLARVHGSQFGSAKVDPGVLNAAAGRAGKTSIDADQLLERKPTGRA